MGISFDGPLKPKTTQRWSSTVSVSDLYPYLLVPLYYLLSFLPFLPLLLPVAISSCSSSLASVSDTNTRRHRRPRRCSSSLPTDFPDLSHCPSPFACRPSRSLTSISPVQGCCCFQSQASNPRPPPGTFLHGLVAYFVIPGVRVSGIFSYPTSTHTRTNPAHQQQAKVITNPSPTSNRPSWPLCSS